MASRPTRQTYDSRSSLVIPRCSHSPPTGGTMPRSSLIRFFLANLAVALVIALVFTVSYHNDPWPWRHATKADWVWIIEIVGSMSLGVSASLWPVIRKDEPERQNLDPVPVRVRR